MLAKLELRIDFFDGFMSDIGGISKIMYREQNVYTK